jgi:hypothetical protein
MSKRIGDRDMDNIQKLLDKLGTEPGSQLSSLAAAIDAAARVDPRDPPAMLQRGVELLQKLGPSININQLRPVSEMQEKVEQLSIALATAQGERDQFRRERDNLIHGGRGLMYPSGWTAENGDTQYMFNVTIRDTGLIVQNTAPANRIRDEAWSYIDQFPFDVEIPERTMKGLMNIPCEMDQEL